ncbi:hypothetical protein B0H63DRAFT_85085 [Podospora didyma]|uniref:Uncharacterized protein n=1 Tax=Podospora didyma TaxID=330526 RepID=A0AAE0K0G4_9PEZI|nr:hypothetical protein B0H63DRAFT_85085 [Podospora didyma]
MVRHGGDAGQQESPVYQRCKTWLAKDGEPGDKVHAEIIACSTWILNGRSHFLSVSQRSFSICPLHRARNLCLIQAGQLISVPHRSRPTGSLDRDRGSYRTWLSLKCPITTIAIFLYGFLTFVLWLNTLCHRMLRRELASAIIKKFSKPSSLRSMSSPFTTHVMSSIAFFILMAASASMA